MFFKIFLERCFASVIYLYRHFGGGEREVLSLLRWTISGCDIRRAFATSSSVLRSLSHHADCSCGCPHAARFPPAAGFRRKDRSR